MTTTTGTHSTTTEARQPFGFVARCSCGWEQMGSDQGELIRKRSAHILQVESPLLSPTHRHTYLGPDRRCSCGAKRRRRHTSY